MTWFFGRYFGVTVSAALVVSTLSGCMTTSGTSSFSSHTAMDRAIGQCVATVAISAGIGALAGAAINGNKGAGLGAIVGGATGLGACGVLVQIADAEDRERVRQAERDAIVANSSRTTHFSNKKGKKIAVTTNVSSAPIPKPHSGASGNTGSTVKKTAKPKFTQCRYSEQTVSVDGQSASGEKQLWCRLDTGDWKAIESGASK